MDEGEELAYNLLYVTSQDDSAIEGSQIQSQDFIYGKGWVSEK
jgi:hypothetical protein